jgi:hypothetical protein
MKQSEAGPSSQSPLFYLLELICDWNEKHFEIGDILVFSLESSRVSVDYLLKRIPKNNPVTVIDPEQCLEISKMKPIFILVLTKDYGYVSLQRVCKGELPNKSMSFFSGTLGQKIQFMLRHVLLVVTVNKISGSTDDGYHCRRSPVDVRIFRRFKATERSNNLQRPLQRLSNDDCITQRTNEKNANGGTYNEYRQSFSGQVA